MERAQLPIEQDQSGDDEARPVIDPIHHGDDDLPAPVDVSDEELGEVIEPEPVEDLTKW